MLHHMLMTVSVWHICNGCGLSLLCNHWQFLLGISATAKPNQTDRTNQKQKNKSKWQDPTLCHYFPLGVCNLVIFLVFFVFFGFLVFWFLVFWFLVGGFKGWQNNTKVKDLGLTLCQFSHFRSCKRVFGWFYCLRWACGSIWKPCKKQWKNAGITGGSLGGLGHRLGNFVSSCKFSKLCV